MKKVALFMDGWKRYFTYAWPLGFMQKIKEARADVNLYIFNSNGNWNRDDGYSYGEYNIYNLPELTDFDGIIISVNNIKYPGVTAELLDRIRKSGVPAISLETAFDGLQSRKHFYPSAVNFVNLMFMFITPAALTKECF